MLKTKGQQEKKKDNLMEKAEVVYVRFVYNCESLLEFFCRLCLLLKGYWKLIIDLKTVYIFYRITCSRHRESCTCKYILKYEYREYNYARSVHRLRK